MQDTAFQPFGPTYLVTGNVVQAVAFNNQQATSYRIRNVTVTNAYLTWSPALPSGSAPSITNVTPAAGVPAPNVIGMVASSVEVFRLPPAAWFQTSVAGTFEVTPGEGI